MPLLCRILMRLAAAWAVLVGGLIATIAIFNGTAWGFIAIVVGVPAVLLCAIALVIRPPLDRASLRRLWRE